MTEYAIAPTLKELKEKYADIRDTPLLLDAHHVTSEMGGHYELRLHTTNRRLEPGTTRVLGVHGYGIEYIGRAEDDTGGLHVWALVEE